MKNNKMEDMVESYELNCKGCNAKNTCNNTIFITKEARIKCPCRVCLIKVICNILCGEFNDFVNSLPYVDS
jgi:hypothetical protein